MFKFSNRLKNTLRWRRESGAGFTIIEVLVVAGIVILFSTVLISNFPQTKLQFALSRTAYKFEQDIRKAQGKALMSNIYKDSSGVQQAIKGYGVYVDTSQNKKYIIYADKSPGNQRYDNQDYIVETIDFSSSEFGIIIKQINVIMGNGVSINFTPPNPITNISDTTGLPSQSIEVIFAEERNLSKTKTVSINTSGLIEVK